MKKFIVVGLLAVSSLTFGVVAVPSCAVVQSPLFGKIEQTVLADILANKTDVEIEMDVATVLGLNEAGTIESQVVAIIADVTQMLIDAGLVPAHILGETKALHDREATHLMTLGGSHR